ncbi:MAG TPA: hypothetical protein VGD68_16540 [Streptosporangiaceae bacterium]
MASRRRGWLADLGARRVVMDTARALERVPELLGTGPHLLATARAGRTGALAGTGGDPNTWRTSGSPGGTVS